MATIDMSLTPVFTAKCIYDPAAAQPVLGVDVNTSKIASAPFHVQIEAVPVGATVELQVRLHPDASWVPIKSYTSADTPTVYVFGHDRFNFVRTVKSGAGNVKVFAQG